jgi:2-polyprenyl-6-methoxyphenol hydroxylase-like FAD-dependent oxidoreductase
MSGIIMEDGIKTQCCIAGGGPAGMMLGLLLARAGVDVVVLEKHTDFFRDFRGDTVHPSTLEVIHELGLLPEFLKLPHQKMYQIEGKMGDLTLTMADFSKLWVHAPYIAFMPQWDFLNFLAKQGKQYPNFKLVMDMEAAGIIEEGDRVAGVLTKNGQTIMADLVVAADGRHSTLRRCAKMEVEDFGSPIDVFWFRLSRKESDGPGTLGRFLPGKIMVTINRQDYWQCAYVIPKGAAEETKARGVAAFRAGIADATPLLSDRVQEIKSWDDVKLLTVQVNRLKEWWKPGLLCIGDAAHAMSPIGGVGINIAVQDAVAAANILAQPLKNKTLTDSDLQKVQARRTFPVRMTQAMQIMVQNRVINRVLQAHEKFEPPLIFRLIRRFPILRRITGRIIGIGFRPEHVKPL